MSNNPSLGIARQMYSEQCAAKQLNIAWDTRIYVKKENSHVLPVKMHRMVIPSQKENSGWLSFRLEFFHWLLKNEKDYDCIVLRYMSYNPFLFYYLKRSKKPVYLVHHTLEVPELSLIRNGLRKYKAPIEEFLGKHAMPLAAGQIGVTQEIINYELSRANLNKNATYVYPNAYASNRSDIVDDNRCKQTPRFLFVASFFYPWHGFDLLLDSIENNNNNFILDVVGDLSDECLQRAKKDKRIKLHGKLTFSEIKELASKADIALSSFALERNGMKEACPLKTREYLSMGLPVYANYIDIFPADFKFFFKDDCDIKKIISFAYAMKRICRNDVHAAALPYIDKKRVLLDFFDWLTVNINKKVAYD